MSTDPPGDDDPRLLELALAITDAKRVDWEGTRQTASDLEETLERMRVIETLASQAALADEAPLDAAPAFTWGVLQARQKLGEGAFGEVWRAWEPSLQREVALKLRRDVAGTTQARWLEEARRLARVRHANVLSVHGADVHEARAGLWSELVRGRTLEQLLLELGPLGPDEAVAIGTRLCSALAAVHAAGLVHGDVKTRNVMREGGPDAPRGAGRIVLMDFGAAHDASASGAAGTPGTSAATPLYSAPELLAGGRPSVATDLYALGVLLYRLVTCAYPVEAATMDELRERLAAGRAVPLRERRADLPAPFVRAVERALATDPAQRFRSAAEFERALEGGAGPALAAPRRRAGRLLAAMLAGAALASAVWFGVPRWPQWFVPEFRIETSHPAVAAASDVVLASDDPRDRVGAAIHDVGDLDGDGRPEIAIGSPGADGGAGRVDLYSLEADGRLTPRVQWRGESPGDAFGWTIDSGDWNGDGVPDVAVSALNSSRTALKAGAVSIYFGARTLPVHPDVVVSGERPLQDFGYALSLHGDVDGDGIADLVVGAPLDDQAGSGAGRVYVVLGGRTPHTRPDLVLASGHAHSQFGIAVEDGADLDGDGIADIAVGANWDPLDGGLAGIVYVYRGGRTLEAAPDRVLHGPGEGAWFGTRLLATADFDGDGYRDLAVSSLWRGGLVAGAGSVAIFRGGPGATQRPWRTVRGGEPGDEFGDGIAEGDVNGDGRPDLLVGVHQHSGASHDNGALDVFFGGPRMDETCDVRIEGRQPEEGFGFAFAPLPARPGEGGGVLVGSSLHQSDGVSRGGRVTRVDFRRYVLLRPRAGERVAAAGVPLAWRGAEPATISRSDDGGRTWRVIAAHAGGREENVLVVTPAANASSVRWRIAPADSRWSGSVETATLPVVR